MHLNSIGVRMMNWMKMMDKEDLGRRGELKFSYRKLKGLRPLHLHIAPISVGV